MDYILEHAYPKITLDENNVFFEFLNAKRRFVRRRRTSCSSFFSRTNTFRSCDLGFFWSNVARRFRLALRPAKSRVRDSSTSPPVTNADVAKYYDNIQPRRPIKDDILTPVNARPALEVFRQAHEQATRRAVSNDKSGD